jgi:hypothetical protein
LRSFSIALVSAEKVEKPPVAEPEGRARNARRKEKTLTLRGLEKAPALIPINPQAAGEDKILQLGSQGANAAQ